MSRQRIVDGDVGLTENTVEGAYGHLPLLWDHGKIHDRAARTSELHVTALLADLDKASCFKTALDFAEGLRGLSRPNRYLDVTQLGRVGGLRRLEV